MTPKTQMWPVLSRSSWMTDGLPLGLQPIRVGGDLSAKRTNGLPLFFFFFFFLFFFQTHWNDRLSCTHTQQDRGGREGMTQRRTAAQQHWSGRVVVIWTLYGQKKTQLERFDSVLQASCVCIYSTRQIWTESDCFFFLSCSFSVFCPTAPFYLSRQKWTEPAITLFVTHIVWVLWISSAKKTTVNVYVVVYWKLYLHMYVFFSFFFLIMQSFDTVYQVWIFTGRGPYLSDQIASVEHVPPASTLMWIGPAQSGLQLSPGPWEAPEPRQKRVRNVKGHILDGEELRVIPRSLRNVKRPVSSIRAAATPIPTLLLSRVLMSRRQCCRRSYLEVFRG